MRAAPGLWRALYSPTLITGNDCNCESFPRKQELGEGHRWASSLASWFVLTITFEIMATMEVDRHLFLGLWASGCLPCTEQDLITLRFITTLTPLFSVHLGNYGPSLLGGVLKWGECMCVPQRCCKARCVYMHVHPCVKKLCWQDLRSGVCVCVLGSGHIVLGRQEPAPLLEQAPGWMELPQWTRMVPVSANRGHTHLNVTRNHLKSHYFELIYLNFYRNLIRVKYVIISPITILQKCTYNARTP